MRDAALTLGVCAGLYLAAACGLALVFRSASHRPWTALFSLSARNGHH